MSFAFSRRRFSNHFLLHPPRLAARMLASWSSEACSLICLSDCLDRPPACLSASRPLVCSRACLSHCPDHYLEGKGEVTISSHCLFPSVFCWASSTFVVVSILSGRASWNLSAVGYLRAVEREAYRIIERQQQCLVGNQRDTNKLC